MIKKRIKIRGIEIYTQAVFIDGWNSALQRIEEKSIDDGKGNLCIDKCAFEGLMTPPSKRDGVKK